MSDVIKALEHMAEHGGVWKWGRFPDLERVPGAGFKSSTAPANTWFLALDDESLPPLCVTQHEIQNFLAGYRAIKRQIQQLANEANNKNTLFSKLRTILSQVYWRKEQVLMNDFELDEKNIVEICEHLIRERRAFHAAKKQSSSTSEILRMNPNER